MRFGVRGDDGVRITVRGVRVTGLEGLPRARLRHLDATAAQLVADAVRCLIVAPG